MLDDIVIVVDTNVGLEVGALLRCVGGKHLPREGDTVRVSPVSLHHDPQCQTDGEDLPWPGLFTRAS